MVLYSKFSHGSQFSEEQNGLEIRFLVPEIFKKYKRSIFFRRPVDIKKILDIIDHCLIFKGKTYQEGNRI